MRWPLEVQLANVERDMKKLRARKRAILAQMAEIEQQKDQAAVKELYKKLKEKGVTPDAVNEMIKTIDEKKK
jgi:phosphotransacetylase